MIVAVMQPYFFPYIGYFQLMAAVDAFVFLDDAQYMKGGWVNRNRIRLAGATRWWTRAVDRDAPLSAGIQSRTYAPDSGGRPLAQFREAYGRSARGQALASDLEAWLHSLPRGVADFNIATLQAVAQRLGIEPRWARASALSLGDGLRGQDRVLAICRALGATHYVNAIGGVDLYDDAAFRAAGLSLSFLRTTAGVAPGSGDEGHLSILHEAVALGWPGVVERLSGRELLPAGQARGLAP